MAGDSKIAMENGQPADATRAGSDGLPAAAVEDERMQPQSPKKRARSHSQANGNSDSATKRQKGVAPIKPEFLVHPTGSKVTEAKGGPEDDDAAEAADDRYQKVDARDNRDNRKGGKNRQKDKKKGQNTSRSFGSSHDALQLCTSRARSNEFSNKECPYGAKCKFEHDLRKYLREGRREDLSTFDGQCPVYAAKGVCYLGWKCRFHKSHSTERTTEHGTQELILLDDPNRMSDTKDAGQDEEIGLYNVVPRDTKIQLARRKFELPRSDAYLQSLNEIFEANKKATNNGTDDAETQKDNTEENRAQYREAALRPSEKRRIYYGPETPVLAPLTTQGNLPFRRLCVELGAQATWSEMAMGLPLIQGEKSEWALMKAHESEITPPSFDYKNAKGTVVQGYDHSKDLKFGAQIAANKPWLATKTVEVLTTLCPQLRAIDLNCGCPINLVCEKGCGSALLDNRGKLEGVLRSMNVVSGETPITVKIRMGTKDNDPTAQKLVNRLVLGGPEAIKDGRGPAGIAAITLHGRSKQQRYTRSADWSYIAETAAMINRLKQEKNELTDTVRETDSRDLANNGHVYFLGNGDCYSHEDYYQHINEAKVDSVMIARGALIKPWIFEEIEKGQYLDKSASERLTYVEKFAKYGLETWGSDEMGIGVTRRFLLEYLSFAHRYVPIAMLEHKPPNIQDRAPAYKGRNDLESLMASENYRDWIKISEMFLGKASDGFKFEPKHKSNAYESIEAEG